MDAIVKNRNTRSRSCGSCGRVFPLHPKKLATPEIPFYTEMNMPFLPTARFLACACLAALALPSPAADKQDAFLDPQNAGPDYPIQGEYAGDNCAAQVIALGDGHFHIVGWTHGLPGAAAEAERKVEVDAKRDGDAVVFDGSGWKGAIAAGILTGTDKDGKKWELKRTVRESPTANAKPPAGATMLFDGTNADAWEGGRIDERHFLAGGTKSKAKFQNFSLHVEFFLPFKPFARGQERANSGVYLQDRYEIQVLDSFGLKSDAGDCAAVYSQHAPLVNACYPPLQWQTYDVEFTAAQFDADGKKIKNAVTTVKQNGVIIQEKQEIKGSTGGGQKETPEPGPFQLQAHGNPVYFKNIWVVEKK